MMKKLYETLDLETVRFAAEDVLATSGDGCQDDDCEDGVSYTCEGHEE